MWPFRRRRAEEPATSSATGRPSSSRLRRDWAALPPLQRTVGPTVLTVERDSFEQALATLRKPATSLIELGHVVDPDGPAGVIEDLVTVVAPTAATGAGGPELPLRAPAPPVARRAATPSPVPPSARGALTVARLVSPEPRPLEVVGTQATDDPPAPAAPLEQETAEEPASAVADEIMESAAQPAQRATAEPVVVAEPFAAPAEGAAGEVAPAAPAPARSPARSVPAETGAPPPAVTGPRPPAVEPPAPQPPLPGKSSPPLLVERPLAAPLSSPRPLPVVPAAGPTISRLGNPDLVARPAAPRPAPGLAVERAGDPTAPFDAPSPPATGPGPGPAPGAVVARTPAPGPVGSPPPEASARPPRAHAQPATAGAVGASEPPEPTAQMAATGPPDQLPVRQLGLGAPMIHTPLQRQAAPVPDHAPAAAGEALGAPMARAGEEAHRSDPATDAVAPSGLKPVAEPSFDPSGAVLPPFAPAEDAARWLPPPDLGRTASAAEVAAPATPSNGSPLALPGAAQHLFGAGPGPAARTLPLPAGRSPTPPHVVSRTTGKGLPFVDTPALGPGSGGPGDAPPSASVAGVRQAGDAPTAREQMPPDGPAQPPSAGEADAVPLPPAIAAPAPPPPPLPLARSVPGSAAAVAQRVADGGAGGGTVVRPVLGRRDALAALPGPAAPAPVPSGVRAAVEAATGSTLSDVAVQRGDAAATSARQLGAHAFTDAGRVHLPDQHGSVETGPARALLAHELVHVVQQRQLGNGRPAEGTPAGQRLELRALQVERAVERGGPLPLASPSPAGGHEQVAAPADPAQAAIDAGVAHRGPDGSVVFGTPPPAPDTSGAGPQRRAEAASPEGGDKPGDKEAKDKEAYDAIRRQLLAELRMDRERAGLVGGIGR